MKYAPLAMIAVLAGCPSDDDGNPSKLWFAPNGSETELRLQDSEPSPWWAPGVGAGGSEEAAFDLKASIPSGTYHFVLDCVVIAAVDMQFDLMQRRGADNTVITTWTHHFDPLQTGFDAQKYELDMQGAKVDFVAGDKLVFRYSASNTIQAEAWIPNGDGKLSNGRVPNITLPKWAQVSRRQRPRTARVALA